MKKILLSMLVVVFNLQFSFSEVITDLTSFSFPKRDGREVLILMSDKISSFEEVEQGILESLSGYNVFSYNFNGDTNFIKNLPNVISRIKPTVIIALGSSVLDGLVGKTDVPVLFSMVINYKKLDVEKYDNIAGVSLQVPVESIFFNLKTIYPNFKKVGVICSQEYYNSFISLSVSGVKLSLDVEIIPSIISSSKDFLPSYNALSKEVDVMWMVPDTTVLDKNSIIYFITESFKSVKPTIVYSEPFVKAGGFFSISPNYNSIGSQLSLMVRRIVEDGVKPSELGIVPVVGTFITVNKEVAKKLGISDSVLSLVDSLVE